MVSTSGRFHFKSPASQQIMMISNEIARPQAAPPRIRSDRRKLRADYAAPFSSGCRAFSSVARQALFRGVAVRGVAFPAAPSRRAYRLLRRLYTEYRSEVPFQNVEKYGRRVACWCTDTFAPERAQRGAPSDGLSRRVRTRRSRRGAARCAVMCCAVPCDAQLQMERARRRSRHSTYRCN
eukprot:6213850-Pleurochrysis_carterae.AAC.2